MEKAVSLQNCIRALDYAGFQIALLQSLQQGQQAKDKKKQNAFNHLDGQDTKGMTPLIIAASHPNNIAIRFVLRLLDAGANPDIPCSKGLKPLDYAVQSNSLLVKDTIVKHRTRLVALRRCIGRDLYTLHMLHPLLMSAVSRCSVEPLTPKALSLWVQGGWQAGLSYPSKIVAAQSRSPLYSIQYDDGEILPEAPEIVAHPFFQSSSLEENWEDIDDETLLQYVRENFTYLWKHSSDSDPHLNFLIGILAGERFCDCMFLAESCICQTYENCSENQLVKALHPQNGNLLVHIRILFGRDGTLASLQRYFKKRVVKMNMRISYASQAIVAELRCGRASATGAKEFDELWIEKMNLAFSGQGES